MIDKPDPAKDAGRTDGPGVKRPHATLDLKATEVKPASTAPDAGSASSSSASTMPPPSSPSTTPSSPQSAATPSAAASSAGSTSSSSAASSSASKPPPSTSAAGDASKASASSGAPKATPKPDSKSQGASGGGGFFSHLAAGVIGGGLVYAGAALLGPGWLPNADGSSDLAKRVATLEASPKGDASLAAKLGDTESRLAKLDTLEQSVAALNDAQNKLAADTKSLTEAAQSGDGAASDERIAKLEDQLRVIAASVPSSGGGVPQVAALAGKISDLETSLGNQIAGLRKGLPQEIDARTASTAEASEAAKSASTRLDREVTQLRAEQARGAQAIETAKADTVRLSSAVDAVKEETGRLSSTVGELRSSIDSQLKSVARPADVLAAVGPVNTKLAELEQNVQTVVQSEQSRKQNAERIVLSLELSNLKRALDRGQGHGYADQLAEVRKASAGTLDLAPLERFADTGVATPAELKAEFRPVMNAVIDADLEPDDGSVMDRLLAGAKSVVRVRRISHEADDTSTEAIVARIEAALNDGRLGDVITQAKTLPPKAQAPIEDWLIKVTARNSVDQAIAAIEGELKASLAGTSTNPPAATPSAPAAPVPPAPAQN